MIHGRTTAAGEHPAGPVRQWVRLADRVVPVDAVCDEPERWTGLFSRARSEVGFAECLCHPEHPQRLQIRSRSGRFHLAVWPEQGSTHRSDCRWWRPNPALSGAGSYTLGAIITTGAGTSIRLATPLSTAPTAGVGEHESQHHHRAGNSRNTVSLLGLLHWLCEQAGLSVWQPTGRPRSWSECRLRLIEVSTGTIINKQQLTEILYVVPTFTRSTADSNAADRGAFLQHIGVGNAAKGLVLGEIKAVEPSPHGMRIIMRHCPIPVYCTAGLAERLRRSFRSAFADIPRARRLLIAVVSRDARSRYLNVEEAALQLTTTGYVPVESAPELQMADRLVACGRSFVKPLRYDGDAVFPDFVLIDTEPHIPIEVWGRHDPDYLRRKREKQDHYAATGNAWIGWDAGTPLPNLARRGPYPAHTPIDHRKGQT